MLLAVFWLLWGNTLGEVCAATCTCRLCIYSICIVLGLRIGVLWAQAA